MNLWKRIIAAIEGEASTIEAYLSPFEQKYLPQAIALLEKIEKTGGEQIMTLARETIGDAVSSAETGSPLGVAITAAVVGRLGEAEADIKADLKTALYGAFAITVGARDSIPPVLPAAAEAPTGTPAGVSAS